MKQPLESTEFFKALVENSLDAVAVVDETGTILYESPSVERVLGYKPEELIGRNALDFLHPEDVQKVAGNIVTAKKNPERAFSSEVRFLHKDGTWRVLEGIGCNLLHNPEVNGIVTNYRDVTERRQMEEALWVGEERYRLITENVGDVIWTMDMDLNFTYISPSTQRLIGYTPEEETAIGLAGILTPASLELAWETYERTLAVEESTDERKPFGSVTVDLDHIHKDGSIVPTEVRMTYLRDRDGRPQGILGITRDVTKRKQDEKALQESEEKYRNVVERASDGITVIQDGIIKYANRRSLELIGYMPEEMIGTPIANYIHPEELPKLKSRYERRMAGQDVETAYETILLLKDGRRVDAELNAGLIMFEGRPADLVIVRDITERKRAEEGLRESEELFRALFENSSDAIAILNSDGTIRYESPSVTRILGYSPEELIGKAVMDYVHPEDIPNVINAFDSTLTANTEQAVSLVVRFLHKDGSWRTVEGMGTNLLDNPKVNGIIVNYRDITESRKADMALRESEERFRSVLDNSFDMIYRMDLRSGKYDYISPASMTQLGYDPEEYLALGPARAIELVHPDDVDMFSVSIISLMGPAIECQHTSTVVYRIKHRDLGYRWVTDNISVIRDDSGAPIAVVGNLRDITERKAVEDALRESEEQYSAVVQNVADAVFRFREGQITWANDRIGEILGYSKGEMVGFDASLFLPSDISIQEVYREVGAALEERGFFHGRTKAKRKDGSIAEIEYSASLIPGKKPPELVGVARDITERKMAEEALQRREEYYRSLLENAMEGIAVINRDGTLRSTSPSADYIIGRESQERIGANIFENIHPDDLPNIAGLFEKLLNTSGGTAQAEVRVRHEDGTYRTIEVIAKNLLDDPLVDGIVANFRDITERKQAEESLLIKDNAIEKSLTAIAITDIQGTITYVNEACLRLWRIAKREDVVGQSFWALLKLDADAADMVALSMIERGQWRGELKFSRRDGEQIDVEVLTAMVYDTHGKAIQTITSFVDVTDRRKMQQQLLLSGRLAAVGELAAGVAHELNNPLAAVQAFAQYLAEKKDLDESVRCDVTTIFKESQRASKITGNLLSFARRHKPEKTMISINQVIEKCLELNSYRLITGNIEVLQELCSELPETMADFHQMEQVFVNIINNAEQAMTEENGRGKLIIKTEAVAHNIKVTFIDDGPGISEEHLASIFDPFFTTKDVGEGTGLGLSISYGIIQEHNGHLYVESKPGQGSAFIVELPVVSADYAEKDVK
ncbi:MAG: PAS domain S-box protein [Dehalococcoidia bacterium]|nr:MAG: PAS domain S-box protein [Dehalococcoidia bacterium]